MNGSNPHVVELNEHLRTVVVHNRNQTMAAMRMISSYKKAIESDVELKMTVAALGAAVFTMDWSKAGQMFEELKDLVDVAQLTEVLTNLEEAFSGEMDEITQDLTDTDDDNLASS